MSLCDADYAGMSWQRENARTFIGRAGRRFDTRGASAEPGGLAPGSFDFEMDQTYLLVAEIAPPASLWPVRALSRAELVHEDRAEHRGREARRRSLAAPRSCSSSQAVQRTAKGNARSRCSEISPAHSAQ